MPAQNFCFEAPILNGMGFRDGPSEIIRVRGSHEDWILLMGLVSLQEEEETSHLALPRRTP